MQNNNWTMRNVKQDSFVGISYLIIMVVIVLMILQRLKGETQSKVIRKMFVRGYAIPKIGREKGFDSFLQLGFLR